MTKHKDDEKDYIVMNMRFPNKMHEALRKLAYKENIKMADFIRLAIDKELLKLSREGVLTYRSTVI